MLKSAGFTVVGAMFYPPREGYDNPYLGVHHAEYERRTKEGYTTPVFASSDGTIVAETNCEYGADRLWLGSMSVDGRVLWTVNDLAHTPPVAEFPVAYEAQLNALQPALRGPTAALLKTGNQLFRPELGPPGSKPLAGLRVMRVPTLDLETMLERHREAGAQLGTLHPLGEVAGLIAITERSTAISTRQEAWALSALLLGWFLALTTALWMVWSSTAGFGAVCAMGGMLVLFVFPGIPLVFLVLIHAPASTTFWLPGPWRSSASEQLSAARARPPAAIG